MMKLLHTLATLSLLGLVSLAPAPSDSGDSDDSDSIEPGGITYLTATNNCTCGVSNKGDQRIVGGRVTKPNEYPMIAGLVLRDKDILFCGSTIITQRHLVTAAHCTYTFNPEEVGVHVGHHNYHEVKGFNALLEPEEFILHEKFHFVSLRYDISIIVMKNPISFDSVNIGPVCMPTYRYPIEGNRIKALGWGHTSYRGETSDVLLKVNLDVKPLDFCEDDNPKLDLKVRHQICTFSAGKDTCNGDSGGPLMYLDPATERYTLVALTSYGFNCNKYPAVGIDVGYFLPWITNIIYKTDPRYQTCAKI